MNDRTWYLQERETPRAWARRVWGSWTPMQRAEFAAAIQIVMEANRGAGDGTPARKRRRDQSKDEFKAAHRPFYKYTPDPSRQSRKVEGDY